MEHSEEPKTALTHSSEAVRVGIGDSVCDKYSGACGAIVDILDDEVLIEPTTRKKVDEYLETTEPPIRAKKINLEPDHIRRYEELSEMSADHELLLHFGAEEFCSPGLVLSEARAKATPCTCFTYRDRHYCWSKGVIGLLKPEQQEVYCAAGKEYKPQPRLVERYTSFAEAAEEAHKKIEAMPKGGERLEAWLTAMGEELSKRGIAV